MKGFLLKTLAFFLILLFLGSGIFWITFMLSYNNVSNITLDKEVNILICGDSHTKTALNDSIIPNSLNIAHSSEHYMYSYNVLQVLLRNNPQITKVILGLSYHNLSSFYDANVFEKSKTQYMYPRYFVTLDFTTIANLVATNPSGFFGDFKDIYHGVYRHINAKNLGDYSFIGWFYDSDRNNKNDSTINSALEMHYFPAEGEVFEASAFQMEYILEIVQLCNDMNVQLILLACPLSKEYRAGVPLKFQELYTSVKTENNDCIWDYHNFVVPDSCWGDGDHLNLSGSMIFSDFIAGKMAAQSW